jgi:ribokinase
VKKFDVVVVGSANLDLVATLEHLPTPGETILALDYAEHAGGKGLNQAVACARMGARTAFVGCVGRDDAGSYLREVLEREGIDTSLLRNVESPTGRAFINVDQQGENAIVVVSGANAEVTPVELPEAAVVLLQLEIPLPTVVATLRAARSKNITTVLNPAPAQSLNAELLSLVDVAVPNENEARLLGGKEQLLTLGVREVVTTLGERGAEVASRDGLTTVPPHVVTPVDTVGAGDAFTGAMCAMLAQGWSVKEATRVGAVAGALATTVHGAVPSLPTRQAVDTAIGGLSK